MSLRDPAALLACLGSVPVDDGLTDAEFACVEQTFGFRFAEDHRALLAAGLPVGAGWPNWRADGRRVLHKQLALPTEGIRFAVEWQGFWPAGWGIRPARMKDALRSADYHLARVPRLIPLHTYRYLPADGTGSPVLSVVQTAVTVVGADLADFFATEFGAPAIAAIEPVGTVAFWSDLSVPGSRPGS